MSPCITLQNLVVNRGRTPAVSGVSLELRPGSSLALLGANGAGKTSLIRALLGLLDTETGSGTVLGHPLGRLPESVRRRIGFVSEEHLPPPTWTLERLLAYLRPLYPTWDDALTARLVAGFGLPADQPFSEMSRGMRVKVAMVAALAYRPALLVLDEPFGGLDPLSREELIDGLVELMQDGEWSVLMSSHETHEVDRLCDRMALMDSGRIVFEDTLENLRTRFRRWTWRTTNAAAGAALPSSWGNVRREGDRWDAVQSDFAGVDETRRALEAALGPISDLRDEPLDLREIIIAAQRLTRA